MEPKYLAFRKWLGPPQTIILWRTGIGSLGLGWGLGVGLGVGHQPETMCFFLFHAGHFGIHKIHAVVSLFMILLNTIYTIDLQMHVIFWLESSIIFEQDHLFTTGIFLSRPTRPRSWITSSRDSSDCARWAPTIVINGSLASITPMNGRK